MEQLYIPLRRILTASIRMHDETGARLTLVKRLCNAFVTSFALSPSAGFFAHLQALHAVQGNRACPMLDRVIPATMDSAH